MRRTCFLFMAVLFVAAPRLYGQIQTIEFKNDETTLTLHVVANDYNTSTLVKWITPSLEEVLSAPNNYDEDFFYFSVIPAFDHPPSDLFFAKKRAMDKRFPEMFNTQRFSAVLQEESDCVPTAIWDGEYCYMLWKVGESEFTVLTTYFTHYYNCQKSSLALNIQDHVFGLYYDEQFVKKMQKIRENGSKGISVDGDKHDSEE